MIFFERLFVKMSQLAITKKTKQNGLYIVVDVLNINIT